MNLVCLGSVGHIGSKYSEILRILITKFCQGEQDRLTEVKNSCWNAYLCNHCGSNCIRGKHITLNLGSNDILKRELPNYEYSRNPCKMRWQKALTHLMHKLEASYVQEVFILEIPKFDYIPNMSMDERYFLGFATGSRIFI